METTTTDEPRAFPLRLRSLTMTERRIMASKFAVNWDAVELDMSEVPQPEDREHPTDAEKLAIAKAFVRIIGPNEQFALLFTAVKRQLPAATEAEIARRADAGEWVLDLSEADKTEVPAADPLPPPPTTSNESS